MPPKTPRQPAKRSAVTTPDNAATRTPMTAKTPATVKPRRFDIGLTDTGPKSTYSNDAAAAAAARAATPQRPEDLRFEDEGDELEWDFRYKRHKTKHVPDGDDVDDDDIDPDATPRPRSANAAAAPVTPSRQGFAVTRSLTTARSNMMKVAADLAESVAATTSPAPASAAPTPARTPKAATPTSAAAALAAMASPSLAKTRPLSRTGAVPGSPASPTPARKTSSRHRAATPAKPASAAARLSTAASRAKTPRRGAAAVSDDEVVDSGPEEEEEEDEDDEDTVDPSISLLARARQIDHAWEQTDGDGILSLFFESQTGGSKTSDNTLASLPQLAHQEYVSLLHSIPVRSAPAIAHLQDLHVQCFPQWRFELHEGYNLLFFGVGSKRTLVDRFVHEVLAHDGDVVTVAGFHPLCSVKSVLSTLSRALECASPATLHDHVAAVAAALDDREDPLYLVVHNIDAPGLRADRAQTTLAQLASHARVRVVATADHIHAALQWDYLKLARFNWLPHHVATFAPYHVETAFENTLMVKPGVVTAQSARTVLQSLPPNSRECFRILATHVLGKGDQDVGRGTAPAAGMSYQAWFSRCREQFLVSEEANFRTIVTEFKDHQMVATRRVEGVDMLAIPLPPQAIESVLESMS